MDDATQGLNELLSWSTDFNGSAYNLAGSIAAALFGRCAHFRNYGIGHEKVE